MREDLENVSLYIRLFLPSIQALLKLGSSTELKCFPMIFLIPKLS